MFWANLAFAQDWPQLHSVEGVAADDRLNVREAPDASGTIIGHLAPDARDIEVVGESDDGRWGLVNIGERAGWANLRFLEVQGDVPERPRDYICFGTEPFWAFTDRVRNGYKFQFPDAEPLGFRATEEGLSQNRVDRYFITGANDESTFGAVIRADACNDGMSDRAYGMSIDLGLFGAAGSTFVSGCCFVGR